MSKKEQNNHPVGPDDHTLPRSVILRGRDHFQQLFQQSAVKHAPSFQLRYRFLSGPLHSSAIGFIAPKRIFKKAVQRNRVKRLMREAFRLHQSVFWTGVEAHGQRVHAALIATKPITASADAEQQVVQLLHAFNASGTSAPNPPLTNPTHP
ncbi:MAG: ribonuclease P protein component [Balneolaceae bacterium]